jgi:hypothetical protein
MAGRHSGSVGLLVGAIPERDLDKMVEEATVDAYGEDEELAGFHAVLTDRLALPFNTRVLGVDVVVEDLVLRPGTGVVALCRLGAHRQAKDRAPPSGQPDSHDTTHQVNCAAPPPLPECHRTPSE